MEKWELFQPPKTTKTSTSTDDHKALFQTKKENFVEFSNALKRVVVERIKKVGNIFLFKKRIQKKKQFIVIRNSAIKPLSVRYFLTF